MYSEFKTSQVNHVWMVKVTLHKITVSLAPQMQILWNYLQAISTSNRSYVQQYQNNTAKYKIPFVQKNKHPPQHMRWFWR